MKLYVNVVRDITRIKDDFLDKLENEDFIEYDETVIQSINDWVSTFIKPFVEKVLGHQVTITIDGNKLSLIVGKPLKSSEGSKKPKDSDESKAEDESKEEFANIHEDDNDSKEDPNKDEQPVETEVQLTVAELAALADSIKDKLLFSLAYSGKLSDSLEGIPSRSMIESVVMPILSNVSTSVEVLKDGNLLVKTDDVSKVKDSISAFNDVSNVKLGLRIFDTDANLDSLDDDLDSKGEKFKESDIKDSNHKDSKLKEKDPDEYDLNKDWINELVVPSISKFLEEQQFSMNVEVRADADSNELLTIYVDPKIENIGDEIGNYSVRVNDSVEEDSKIKYIKILDSIASIALSNSKKSIRLISRSFVNRTIIKLK